MERESGSEGGRVKGVENGGGPERRGVEGRED